MILEEYSQAELEEMLFVLTIILIILGAFLLINYILSSFVRMKVFRLFGTCAPAMAWIPFVSNYYLGKTCNGLDGGNIGIFGMRVPNWMYNFGWLFGVGASVVANALDSFVPGAWEFASTFSQVFLFLYWASIYSFLFSRMEGRYENEVRIISVISGIFGWVGAFKVLVTPVDSVFSLQNDMYPEQKATRWSSPGEPWGDEYDDRF